MMTDNGIITSEQMLGAQSAVDAVLPPAHSGEMLRRAREAQGKSLAEISRIINVQERYLDALENLDISRLPARGYVLGFVRAYALELGLNPRQALDQFKACYAGTGAPMKCKDPLQKPKSRMKLPKGILGAGILMTGFCALAVWFMGKPVVDPEAGFAVPIAAAPATAADESLEFGLRATGTSWIQIKDSGGEVVFSRVLIAGDTVPLDPAKSWTVSVRNAGAIALVDASQDITVLGAPNEPVSNIDLGALRP